MSVFTEKTSEPKSEQPEELGQLEGLSQPEGLNQPSTNRRSFLKWGLGLTGAGLVVGIGYGYQHRFDLMLKAVNYLSNRDFDPQGFVIIPTVGKIQLVCHRSEMGQGVRTALPMILSDELGVSLDEIEVVQADGHARYGNQNTDGSSSVRDFYVRLRKAAAGVREILEQAAAEQWGVFVEECVADQGVVRHLRSQRTLRYQELAQTAAKFSFPLEPKLKEPRKLRLIGRPQTGVDVDRICRGQAVFGADVQLPDMVYACAVRAPIPGARLKHYDATDTKKIAGVLDVVTIDAYGTFAQNNAAVCVIASHTWAAMQGIRTLKAEWDTSGLKRDHSAAAREELLRSLHHKPTVYRSEGYVEHVEKGAKHRVEAVYSTPFLVHAPMEPMVCTARVTTETCEVWAPTQDPQRAAEALAKLLQIPKEKITIHVTMLGGGFGRKSQPDFVVEAVAIAKTIGKPVRLQWTREDEIKHGFYHAESVQRLVATLDEQGMPVSWRHQFAYPTLMNVMWPGHEQPQIFEAAMGATNLPYRIPHILCEAGKAVTPVRVGWYRSVCNLFQSFAVNSFIDELAAQSQLDPVDFRLRLLGKPRLVGRAPGDQYPQNTGRLADVIRTVRDAFGWHKPLPPGHGKGFANHYSFQSYVALAMEVSCQNGIVRVHRVVCAIDCGLAVNPDSVKAQMEGAVAFGLSAALYGKITLKDGVVEQNNFHDYPLLRIPEMPNVEVHIINGAPHQPTGVGEPGVPVVAPALSSAVFSATGKRIRELPIADKLI